MSHTYPYILFIPYFGSLPNYFDLWAASCAYNTDFLFIIFTDSTYSKPLPTNVKLIACSFQEIKQKIQSLFDFPISLDTPYKFCDYKPLYGYLFSEYLSGAKYWGHCDIDLIWGDISKFLPKQDFDKISHLGHFCLYKNTPDIIHAFRLPSPHAVTYKDIIASPVHFGFDELPDYGINPIFYHNKLTIYPYEKHVAEVSSTHVNFFLNHCDYPRRTREYGERIFSFERGKVFGYTLAQNTIQKTEYAYVHLQKRKMISNISKPIDDFLIFPNSFENWQKPTFSLIKKAQNSHPGFKSILRNLSIRKKTAPRRLLRMWTTWQIKKKNTNKCMKGHYKLGLVGYFAVGKSKSGGQEAKTCAVTRELQKHYSRNQIRKVDSGNWKKAPFQFFKRVIHLLLVCPKIIMFPAHNSVQILSPIFVFFGKPFGRKIHYVVIGGWLPEMTKHKKWLAYFLKKFDGIYVETSSMKIALEKQGFKNIFIMPNFKNLQILQEKDLVYTTKEPFAFCTFSRVMKEKGIEDAIEAISQINKQAGHIVATLDIYGKIDENYKAHFDQLQSTFPPYIKYKGVVPANQSVQVLKNYFALLFPTYYVGEGFAGTLLDAMAAGVPVIASDWKYNKEIVVDGKTGVIIKKSLFDDISKALSNISLFNTMKPLCLQEAQKYTPQKAISLFLEQLL